MRDLVKTPGGLAIQKLLESREAIFAQSIVDFRQFQAQWEKIPISEGSDPTQPFWVNGWLPGLDAAAIYGLLARRNPSVYLEIGSGNSTKFARRSISDHGLKTRIVSIDPAPRASIDHICDRLIRAPLEDVAIDEITRLPGDCMIFLDSSHRSFQSSDVTVFFTELLTAIPHGAVWGLHDIFLPYDYPKAWTNRYYNEQYLLTAYLLGGAGKDEILLSGNYVSTHRELSSAVREQLFGGACFSAVEPYGSCFWMERTR